MSVMTDPPRERFELSMLLYDRRYRSLTIQFIALLLLCLGIGYLISNLLANLEARDLNIRWGFLFEPAGYDINQRLLDYNSQDTHLRASIVGVLNTLVVAVLACMFATVIGIFVGVSRLSKNWLVARVSAFYVEIFRNIPVLIWILMILGLFINVFPHPRTFLGDDPENTFSLFNSLAITKQGIWASEPAFTRGLGDWTVISEGTFRFEVSLDLLLIVAVLIGSFFAARWNSSRATAIQEATGARPNTLWTNLAIWLVPLVLVLLALGFHLTGPELTGKRLRPIAGGIWLRVSLVALTFALSVYTAAFIAENVRAGILSVSKGQSEAAASLGLQPNLIMGLVILPQALRVIIPPLISHYLNITKNSSLAIAVGYMDVTGTLGGITLNQSGRAIECVLLLMLFYLIISLSISAIMNVYNNSVKLKER